MSLVIPHCVFQYTVLFLFMSMITAVNFYYYFFFYFFFFTYFSPPSSPSSATNVKKEVSFFYYSLSFFHALSKQTIFCLCFVSTELKLRPIDAI